MAQRQDLPCDADEVCMVCHTIPPDEHVLLCDACGSPWHMQCLTTPLHAAPSGDWSCPDCSFLSDGGSFSAPNKENELVGIVKAIEEDAQLSSQEKARKRQQVLFNDGKLDFSVVDDPKCNASMKYKNLRDILDENLMCIICMQLADRPVTTPCGHNFCLKCFERWVAQSKRNCAKCRSLIPPKMISLPRINATLVMAIRMARLAMCPKKSRAPPKLHTQIVNESRPDKAFTTDRAVCKGKSNACSGRIFVTVPPDHFGPILAKDDPIRHQGVLVGETWEDRLECRQWGVHLPHVAGIAGQSDYGAQSVALSGGYDDDEDHGEWFLYTGSGGRDLSGNKRTAKDQSFDQTFDKYNEALRMSCKKGYPVRVVRSHKEKSSSYAPEKGVRYDGIYRIEKCWRKKGIQGFKVCRYLFVRCDNEPAPWTSDEIGDRPRPLPVIKELKYAIDITERKGAPAWNWKASENAWCWVCDPPESRRIRSERKITKPKDITRKIVSMRDKLKREFACNLCKGTLSLPVTTPCGHNFCSACLDVAFAGQEDMRHRFGVNGRMLRTQKVVKACPSCKGDIADFLINPQVNRQLEEVIRSLMQQIEAPEGNPDGDDDSTGGNESSSDKENKYHDSNKVIKDTVKQASSQTLAIPKTDTSLHGEGIGAVPISVASAGKEIQAVQFNLDGAPERKRNRENKRVTRSTFLGSQDTIEGSKTPEKGLGMTTTQECGDQILDVGNTKQSSNFNGECNEDRAKGSKVTKKSVTVGISKSSSKVLGGLSKKRKRENGSGKESFRTGFQ